MTDRLIKVCELCLKASCYQGKDLCPNWPNSRLRLKTIAELAKLGLEHPDYWCRAVVLILALVSFSPAGAHSWYSAGCCGGKDCHPIDSCDEIARDGDYYVWKGHKFWRGNANPSQDRSCHVCLVPHLDNDGQLDEPTPTCIYLQQGS